MAAFRLSRKILVAFNAIFMAENVRVGYFSAKKFPNVVIVKHWKIQHAIFNVLFCSFLVAMFFQTTSGTNSLLCIAEVARLKGSSFQVFNWCWDQEAVVHGQFSVACLSRTMTKVQLEKNVRLHLVLFSAACN